MKIINFTVTAIALVSQLAYAEAPTDYALKIPLKISAEGGLQRIERKHERKRKDIEHPDPPANGGLAIAKWVPGKTDPRLEVFKCWV